MVNSGLRPDEAWKLQFRDVKIVYDDALEKPFLKSRFAANAASASLNARNTYVAMTRGSKKLIVCARKPVLKPIW